MAGKIRILHILHELHPSGAEMMIRNAYPCWADSIEAVIMATGVEQGPFADELARTGYGVCHIPTPRAGGGRLSSVLAKLAHLRAFYRYMKRERFDVVHIHRESLSFEYALISRLTGNKRIVRTVHSTFAHQGMQRRIKSATRKFMKKRLHVTVVAISDGVAANEKKVFGNVCDRVIYNWCNNETFTFVPTAEKLAAKREAGYGDRLLLITVGNCNQVKRHELLIRALAKCKNRDGLFYLHVGYGGAETEREEQLAEELGISGSIRFLGSADPMPHLKCADVYVMTSVYEGLSIASLEAIFTGMHVLLAEVPGLIEFRDKGLDNVDYYEPTEEALAAKLDELVSAYQSGRVTPSKGQRKRALELYDMKKQAAQYLGLYQSLVTGEIRK